MMQSSMETFIETLKAITGVYHPNIVGMLVKWETFKKAE